MRIRFVSSSSLVHGVVLLSSWMLLVWLVPRVLSTHAVVPQQRQRPQQQQQQQQQLRGGGGGGGGTAERTPPARRTLLLLPDAITGVELSLIHI